MKKLLKIAVCFLLIFSTAFLCGCDDTKKLVGEYEAQRDYTQLFNYIISKGSQTESSVKAYSLKAVEKISFNSDGTYKVTVEEAQKENLKKEAKEQLRVSLVSYYVKLVSEAGLSVTADQYLASVGTSFDDLLNQLKIDEAVDDMFNASAYEGNYKADDGKLYRSNSLETTYDEKVYETYTLEGGVLTLHKAFDENDGKTEEETKIEETVYPIKYVKR